MLTLLTRYTFVRSADEFCAPLSVLNSSPLMVSWTSLCRCVFCFFFFQLHAETFSLLKKYFCISSTFVATE